MSITLPQKLKIVSGTTPVTTNAEVTADRITLKNAISVTVIAKLTQAVGHATALSIEQSTLVAGGDSKVISKVVPIWANEDTSVSDTNELQTRAVNYSVTADVKNKIVMFKVMPADLDVANDFICITLISSASSQITNFIDVTYEIETNYQGDESPSAIID